MQPQNNAQTNATSAPSRSNSASRLVLVLALMLVAANLRPALISVGPVLDSVQESLHLSASAAGFLITLPILCFGIFAPFVPRLLRHASAERIIFLGLLLLAFGIALRSVFGVSGLFTGTLLTGASISAIMVLLPSIIKHHFPTQAGMMMGLYSTALCLGAAITAGVTVPIQNIPGSNWQWALAFWLVPVLIAAVVWRPQIRLGRQQQAKTRASAPRLRSSLLAWQVTMFMGLQSAIAYCVFGWLPFIFIDRGLSQVTAGLALSVTMGVQIITSLSAPWLATRGKDQRNAIAVLIIMTLVGLQALIYAPLSQIWLWTTVMGLGMGGSFSISLALLVLRAPNPQVAAALSGMAQGVGYIVAATGPFVVGLLHELSGNWNGVAVFLALVLLGSLFFGMGAGRSIYIETGRPG